MIKIENISIFDVKYLLSIKRFDSVIDNLMFIKFNTVGNVYCIECLLPDISNFLSALCYKISLKTNNDVNGVSISYLYIHSMHLLYQAKQFDIIDIIIYTINNSDIDILYEFYLYSMQNYNVQILQILDNMYPIQKNLKNYNYNRHYQICYSIYLPHQLTTFFTDISANKIRQHKLNFIDSL